MLGGLYPGLYALTTGTGVEPPELPFETVTSDITVDLLVTASAIECRALVTSSFVEQRLGEQPTPHIFAPVTPGARQLVTSSVVEGWKKP